MQKSSSRERRETFLSFQPPAIGDEEVEAVAETLRSGWLTSGPRTAELEERFAAYLVALGYGLAVLVRRRGAEAAAIGFVWVVLAWTLAVGVLTDLGENYRSRLPVDPLVVALVAVAAHRLLLAIRATVPRRNAEVLA